MIKQIIQPDKNIELIENYFKDFDISESFSFEKEGKFKVELCA